MGFAIIIGRIVGVVSLCLLSTELSTIFLNTRFLMKELDLDTSLKWRGRYIANLIALTVSLALSE